MLAMQMCVASALGENLGPLHVKEGSSLLFLGEESDEEKMRRFGGLCTELNEVQRNKVMERIRPFAAIGKDIRLTLQIAGNPQPSLFPEEVIRLGLEHEKASGISLSFIVLDHTRLVMAGDPNAADDVSQLTRVLADIANHTGAVVILIAHSPKSVMSKEGSSDASEIFGSGAFTDNTRGTFVLHTMRLEEARTYQKSDDERKEYVCLTNVKANYGPTGGQTWFRKVEVPDWQIAKLVPEILYNAKKFPQFSGLSKKVVDLVTATPGGLTVSNIRGKAGKSGPLQASEREVRNTLDRLVEEGELVLEALDKGERAARGLSANVKTVLNLPTAG